MMVSVPKEDQGMLRTVSAAAGHKSKQGTITQLVVEVLLPKLLLPLFQLPQLPLL
jgi:hypothetical protein